MTSYPRPFTLFPEEVPFLFETVRFLAVVLDNRTSNGPAYGPRTKPHNFSRALARPVNLMPRSVWSISDNEGCPGENYEIPELVSV